VALLSVTRFTLVGLDNEFYEPKIESLRKQLRRESRFRRCDERELG
jgi:hypothetical protein